MAETVTHSSLKIAVVGIPGKWSSEALADVIEQKTGYRLLIDMAGVELSLADGGVFYKGEDLTQLDAVVVKKIDEIYAPAVLDRLEILRFLNARGVPVFSRPDAVLGLINRLSCTVNLRAGGIPVPETVITENLDAAGEAIARFGRAVLKPLYSTKAKGMTVVDSGEPGWREAVSAFAQEHVMIYAQKFLEIPGQDLGVVFLGGKYLATYARVGSSDSWNTTIHSGGHYAPYEPSDEIIDMATQAQALFGLDFTCVDVVETGDGPMVFEVSAFGGYRGLRDAHGMDAAALYTTYILDKLTVMQKGAA